MEDGGLLDVVLPQCVSVIQHTPGERKAELILFQEALPSELLQTELPGMIIEQASTHRAGHARKCREHLLEMRAMGDFSSVRRGEGCRQVAEREFPYPFLGFVSHTTKGDGGRGL